MSFIDHYLEKHKLKTLSPKSRKNIEKLENKLKNHIASSKGAFTFDDLLKKHGEDIANLIERASALKDLPGLRLGNAIKTFKLVYSISIEVYQIVESMAQCVVDDTMSPGEAHNAKVQLGQEIVYFIWLTVDPIGNNWIPFKKTIEKKLVFWLAGMALNSVVDLFAAQGMSLFTEGKKKRKGIIKAL